MADDNSHLTATKTLTIIFIIAILLASVCPILAFLRRHGFALDVRKIFVITLTMGGFLIALFPMVIKARLLFDYQAHNSVSCDIPIMATVYESFYYPFVYSTGLIIMALHFIARQRTSYFRKLSPFSSFLMVVSPWLLGLILVLPVMLAGIHWDHGCHAYFSKGRIVAQTWICLLLPVIGVAAAGIAVLVCVKPNSRPCDVSPSNSAYQVIYINGPSQDEVVMSPHGALHRVGSQDRSRNRESRYSSLLPSAPTLPYELDRPPSMYHHRHPHQPYLAPIHSSPPQHYFGSPYHGQSHSYLSQYYDPVHSHPPPLPPLPPPPSIHPPPIPPRARAVSENAIRQQRKKVINDKKVFLRAFVIFFLCSFPTPVFNLGYFLNEEAHLDPSTVKVLIDFVYWITVVRWVLLPLCWCFLK